MSIIGKIKDGLYVEMFFCLNIWMKFMKLWIKKCCLVYSLFEIMFIYFFGLFYLVWKGKG